MRQGRTKIRSEGGFVASRHVYETEDYNVLVSTLDKLDLLDKRLGVIRDSDDFVGSELAMADLADLEFEEDRDAQFL
ncbi:hypothetical protein PRIC1_005415 [Phytophthora ramorum]